MPFSRNHLTLVAIAAIPSTATLYGLSPSIAASVTDPLWKTLCHVGIAVGWILVLELVNVTLIYTSGRSELDQRMKLLWSRRVLGGAQHAEVEPAHIDPLDNLARLHVWLSRAHTVKDALTEERLAVLRERESLTEKIRRAENLERSTFTASVQTLAGRWRSSAVIQKRKPYSADDPIHGRIALDEELSTVLAHPLVQRLNHVKQLSFSYTQYPSASHTRLSHSLGAAKNAELALRGIFSRGVYYEVGGDAPVKFSPEVTDRRDEIIQRAKLAALLHDLGHGPFGHALDHYVGFCDVASSQPRPDKKYTAAYIKEYLTPTLESVGLESTQLLRILDPNRAELTGTDNLIADIVDSSLDVDRMDYLLRDAHMSGLQMGVTNTPALIDAMRPVREADSFLLTYDEDAERYIEHFLFARDMMFFNCYEHPRKKAAERIFSRLVKSLHEDPLLSLDLEDLVALSDEEVLATLRSVGSGSDVRNNLLVY